MNLIKSSINFFVKLYSKILGILSPEQAWKLIASSQNNNIENLLIESLCQQLEIDQSFIEFGFSIKEFNCINLVKKKYKGLLLDFNKNNCKTINNIFYNLNYKTRAKNHWLTVDSLEPIIEFIRNNDNKLGVLSIDIDGNDYWILKEILNFVKPEIIVTEYNASMGYRSITIPYEEDFERFEKHKLGLYHGASLSAFYNLLKNEYILISNIEGLNLVFVHKNKYKNKYKNSNKNSNKYKNNNQSLKKINQVKKNKTVKRLIKFYLKNY